MDNNYYPGVTEESLLRRVEVFLEDGDLSRADEYCERVLDMNVENGRAYLYKLLAELGFSKKQQLFDLPEPFYEHKLCLKIMRFGDEALKKEIDDINKSIIARNEEAARLARYEDALSRRESTSIRELTAACNIFRDLKDYKDSEMLLTEYTEKVESIYDESYNANYLYIKEKEQEISNLKYHNSTALAEKEGYDDYISEHQGRKVFDYSKLLCGLVTVVGVLFAVTITLPLFESNITFTTMVRYLSSRTGPALLITAAAAFIGLKLSNLMVKRQKSNLLEDISTAAKRARELTEEVTQNENEILFLQNELDESLQALKRLNEDFDLFNEAREIKQ